MVINMLVDNDICISSALEDYLESIYEISKQKTSVRITDIALALKNIKTKCEQSGKYSKKARSCFSRALRRYNSYGKGF